MQELEAPAANPEIKELVVEASRALARLDAPRLEELALSCEALNRDLDSMDAGEKSDLARQAREAAPGYGGTLAGCWSDARQPERDAAAA
jgi:hypothetical protein